MRYAEVNITFQEVPQEVSLSFLISGCPLRCRSCHSKEAWNAQQGKELTPEVLQAFLAKYQHYITCVCFLGGEWDPSTLIKLLKLAQHFRLKTCLYTGLADVSPEIKDHLDYLKVGLYDDNFGGLSSKNTNQIFYNLKNNTIMNHFFIKEEI